MPFVKKKKRKKPSKLYVSSGSTLLNLATTGRPSRGFLTGTYILFVGDSETGKTWFSITCMAEAANDPRFDDYELILDDVEYGSLMDIKKYFGDKLAKRIRAPRGTIETAECPKSLPLCSESLEEAYDNIETCVSEGPCIYVLDSMDVLEAKDDQKKAAEDKKARGEGKEVGGSYGMAKAKLNSTRLRGIVNKLRKTKSILIIISQTRDNIGFGFETKTRAGGRALKFYAHLEIWSSLLKKIKKKVNDKDREQGAFSQLKIAKNRYSGWKGKVTVPFLRGYGIDDIGSCIDFLVEEKHWKKGTNGIIAKEFNTGLSRDKLIKAIEQNELVPKLREVCKTVWDDIESRVIPERKPRYE